MKVSADLKLLIDGSENCNSVALTGHCVSQHVQDFRQDHIKLALLRTAYAKIPWIVLTHNASTDVLNDIIENFQLNKPVAVFKKSSFRKNLYHDIIFKNTTLDVFTNLKKHVISCLESDDDDAIAENNVKCFVAVFRRPYSLPFYFSRTKNPVA